MLDWDSEEVGINVCCINETRYCERCPSARNFARRLKLERPSHSGDMAAQGIYFARKKN